MSPSKPYPGGTGYARQSILETVSVVLDNGSHDRGGFEGLR